MTADARTNTVRTTTRTPRYASVAAAVLLTLSPAVLFAYAGQPAPTPTTAPAASQAVGELIGEGIVRFFASQDARSKALPSYALEKARPAQGPAPASFAVRPVFSMAPSDSVVGSTHGGPKPRARIEIAPGTSLYGTGEVSGPLMRNGRSVTTWNTDAYGYGDEAPSLYQSHPWVLAVRADGTAFGVLADTTYRCTIDLATGIQFTADGPEFAVIVVDGPTPQDVLKKLADLTGKMPLPPKWSIGYHQCRYSYFPESRVREIANEFRARQIPADVIWFDIDYFEGFRTFTFNKGHFPDPKKLNADLLAMGFHNVWMINPGVKSREEPSPNDPPQALLDAEPAALKAQREEQRNNFRAIRDAGTKNDFWTKRANGSVYEGEVWPGWCFFPDFTRPDVRAWWATLYKPFMAMGVTGVWNDMNEPAIFNVPSKTMPEDNLHGGDPTHPTGAVTPGDHKRFHNVYGMQMIRASRDGIQAANPDKRPFVLSRANFIGGQRYGATWTGDNVANWYHLDISIPMMLNVGLSGQPNIGPDIGGFAGNGDGQLFARWMGIGAFFPFSRGHTGTGNIDKEPWSFGPEVERASRIALERRYRFMPFLYTLFHEASTTGLPVARPTFFADPTDQALRAEDESFLMGADLLIVADTARDRSRVSILPQGIWRKFDFTTWDGKPDSSDPHQPAMYARGGSIIPTGPVMQYVNEKPLDPLTLIVTLDHEGKASGTMYEDAGDGYGYQAGEFLMSRYSASTEGDTVVVTLAGSEGKMARPNRKVIVRLLLSDREVLAEGVDGQPVRVPLK